MIDLSLTLVRHAQCTSGTTEGTVARKDLSLSTVGREQAQQLASRMAHSRTFAFDKILCSPHKPAVETLNPYLRFSADRLPLVIFDQRLVEIRHPGWDALEEDDREQAVIKLLDEQGYDVCPKDGESLQQMKCRMIDLFAQEINVPRWTETERPVHILLVGHSISMRCLMWMIMGFKWRSTPWIDLGHTSLSTFRYTQHGWSVRWINDTAHLRQEDA